MIPKKSRTFSAARLFGAGMVLFGCLGLVLAEGVGGKAPAKPNRFIGAAKCKSCHKSEESGNQFGAWEEMKHAQAFEVLGGEEAKRIAKERGIPDAQKADECLKCHETAFGEPAELIKKGFKREMGVQCESCHGPGEQHMKARFKAAATAEEGAADTYFKVPEDEIISNPPMATCLGCHNDESPSFKPFCYFEFVPKIRHLDPRKPREEGAALVCGCGDPCPCVEACPEDGCGVPEKTVKKE